MTKERGILFSGEMIQRLLSGEKTQTRRAVKPQPDGQPVRDQGDGKWYVDGGFWCRPCPYGAIGDRLVARETWGIANDGIDRTVYAADYLVCPSCNFIAHDCTCGFRPPVDKWRPSIHLPRSRARIVLEITSVRVERVQDISEADAKAEGAEALFMVDLATFALGGPVPPSTYRNGFGALWRRINGATSWDANPWVWALTFRRVTP